MRAFGWGFGVALAVGGVVHHTHSIASGFMILGLCIVAAAAAYR